MSGWYVVLHSDLVRACEGNAKTAHFIAHLQFRTSTENRETYEQDGYTWWRIRAEALADEMGSSVATVRSSAENALKLGAVVRDRHHLDGPYDRTWSYRVADDWLLTRPHLLKPANEASKSTNELSKSTNVPILPKEETHGAFENSKSSPPGLEPVSVANQSVDNELLARAPSERSVCLEKFDEWWKAYPRPRRGSKPDSRKKFLKLVESGVDPDMLIRAVKAYGTVERVVERKVVMNTTTWLNQERWEDDDVAHAVAAPTDRVDELIEAADFSGLRSLVADAPREFRLLLQEPTENVQLGEREKLAANREYLRGLRSEVVRYL